MSSILPVGSTHDSKINHKPQQEDNSIIKIDTSINSIAPLALLTNSPRSLPDKNQKNLKDVDMRDEGTIIYNIDNTLFLYDSETGKSQSLDLGRKYEPLSVSFVDKSTVLVRLAYFGFQFFNINNKLQLTKSIDLSKKGDGDPICSNKNSKGLFVGARISSPTELLVFDSNGISKSIKIKSSDGKDLNNNGLLHCRGLSLDDDTVYCLFSFPNDHYFQAYSLKDGALVNTIPFNEEHPIRIFTMEGVVLVWFEDELKGFDRGTLEQKYSYKFDGLTDASNVCKIHNNQIFLALYNGQIHIVDGKNGKLLELIDFSGSTRDKINDIVIHKGYLAIASAKFCKIEILDSKIGQCIRTLETKAIPHHLAFDNNYLSVRFDEEPYFQFFYSNKK